MIGGFFVTHIFAAGTAIICRFIHGPVGDETGIAGIVLVGAVISFDGSFSGCWFPCFPATVIRGGIRPDAGLELDVAGLVVGHDLGGGKGAGVKT